MPRDRSRQGAIAAGAIAAAYLPLQPALAWAARAARLEGADGLDGLARWQPAAVVLVLGAVLAGVLAADWRQRRLPGRPTDWAVGAVSGLAVLGALSALLTFAQALLSWAPSPALAVALGVDAAALVTLACVATVVVSSPRRRGDEDATAWPA